MNVLYDAGALVAAERGAREVWVDHRLRLEQGITPLTTAPIVAQVSRGSRQAQLRRFLRGCRIEAFASDDAHAVGSLLARSGTTDVVDAHAALLAAQRGTAVLTSDAGDLRRLAASLERPPAVRPI